MTINSSEKDIENITGLAQSTGLGETSLNKKDYIYYSDQEDGIINKNMTLKLNKVKNILDLDFETNDIKNLYKYTIREIMVSYSFLDHSGNTGNGYLSLSIGKDSELEDISEAIIKAKGLKNISILNIIENEYRKNNQN